MLLPSALGSSPHPPVSVYGTGAARAIAAFLGTPPTLFATLGSLRVTLLAWRAVFPARRLPRLRRALRPRHALPACVPTVLPRRSTGISTCCPSATPSGLALGPDSPRADQLHPGNLGYPAGGIPTPLSLLIPAFSLPAAPRALTGPLPRGGDAPLPARHAARPAASAACFSPGNFRRGASRPVSCYALFECMAASEPTSWLSSRPHILSHLARTLGPWPAVWAVSLSTAQLISCGLTPMEHLAGIRSLIFFGRL